MSSTTHNKPSASDHEHGTMISYVVGFILSLVFTFAAYYLVVNHILSGMTLLVTILVFAVVQMIIQIIFFLHIGRGPKPDWQLYFFVATVGTILIVVGGSVMIMNNLYHNMLPSEQTKKLVNDEGIYQIGGEQTGACKGQHTNHKVTIHDGRIHPQHTVARQCETLTFVNEEDEPRVMTFGIYPKHDAYAGEDQLTVRKGRSKTIILSEPGSYHFHDHHDGSAAGTFTVSD